MDYKSTGYVAALMIWVCSMVKIRDILQNPAQYVNQEIVIEGILALEYKHRTENPLYLAPEKHTYDKLPLRIYAASTEHLATFVLRLSSVGSIRYGSSAVLERFQLLDHAQVRGRLLSSDQFPSGLILDITEVMMLREAYTCYVQPNSVKPLSEVNPGWELTTVSDVVSHSGAFKKRTVRLEGLLIGNDKLDLFYLAPLDSELTTVTDHRITSKSVEISSRLFIKKLVGIRGPSIATEFRYLGEAQLQGSITEGRRNPFPASLVSITAAVVNFGAAVYKVNF